MFPTGWCLPPRCGVLGAKTEGPEINGERPLLDWALWYHDQGFCVLPVKSRAKAPDVGEWKSYQAKRPSRRQVTEWFRGKTVNDRGIGVVCGKVSGDLVILDFDNMETYQALDAEKLEGTIRVVVTGSGKRHLPMFSRRMPPSFRIQEIGLEVRSDGNFTVLPPSIHPSGEPYRYVNRDLPISQVDDAAEEAWKIAEKLGVERRRVSTSDVDWKPRIESLAPCFRAMIALENSGALGDDGLVNDARMAIIHECLSKGFGADHIAPLFSKQPDYGDGLRSKYYVDEMGKAALKEGIHPWSCDTLIKRKWCIAEDADRDDCYMRRMERPLVRIPETGDEITRVVKLILVDGRPHIALSENAMILAAEKGWMKWRFRLQDLREPPLISTAWISLGAPEKLVTSPGAKMIRDKIRQELGDDWRQVLDTSVALIQDNEALWTPEEEEEPEESEPQKDISGGLQVKAKELLRDPALFYKLGKVLEHGFMVPKVNRIRFIVGEERSKRLVPLLLGASVRQGLTSIIRLLGDIGTAKDTIIRMGLELLSQGLKYVERGYITGGAFRYSEEIRKAEVLYVPDSPEMQGEMGRQMRLNRADDGGLIWGIAVKDKETGMWVEQTESIGVKHIITSSSAIRMDPALESGAITVGTDEDPKLTRLVQEEILKLRAGKRPTFPDEELEVWKAAFQIALTEDLPGRIKIPYADRLIALLSKDRTAQRRSPDKLCDMIESIAFWTRFRKEPEDRETADFVDLYHALQIGLGALLKTISPLDQDLRRIFQVVEGAPLEELVTVRYVATETKQAYNRTYKRLEALVDKGYLAKDKSGNRNIYSPILSSEDEDKAKYLGFNSLPRSEEVFSLLEPLYGSDGNSPPLLNPSGHIHSLIDPLTGKRVVFYEEEEGMKHREEEVEYDRVYVSEPHREVESSERGEETAPNGEKGTKYLGGEFLPRYSGVSDEDAETEARKLGLIWLSDPRNIEYGERWASLDEFQSFLSTFFEGRLDKGAELVSRMIAEGFLEMHDTRRGLVRLMKEDA